LFSGPYSVIQYLIGFFCLHHHDVAGFYTNLNVFFRVCKAMLKKNKSLSWTISYDFASNSYSLDVWFLNPGKDSETKAE